MNKELIEKLKRFDNVPNLRILLESIPSPIIMIMGEDIVYVNNKCKDALSLHGMDFLGMSVGAALNCREPLLMGKVCGTGEGCRFCGLRKSIKSATCGGKAETQCGVVRYDGVAVFVKAVITPFPIAGDDCLLICFDEISKNRVTELVARYFAGLAANFTGYVKSSVLRVDARSVLYEAADIFAVRIRECNVIIDAIAGRYVGSPIDFSSTELENDFLKICSDTKNRRLIFESERFSINADKTVVLAICETAVTLFGGIIHDNEAIQIVIKKIADKNSVTISTNVYLGRDYMTARLKAGDPSKAEYAQSVWLYCIWLMTRECLQGEVNFQSTENDGTQIHVLFKNQ